MYQIKMPGFFCFSIFPYFQNVLNEVYLITEKKKKPVKNRVIHEDIHYVVLHKNQNVENILNVDLENTSIMT